MLALNFQCGLACWPYIVRTDFRLLFGRGERGVNDGRRWEAAHNTFHDFTPVRNMAFDYQYQQFTDPGFFLVGESEGVSDGRQCAADTRFLSDCYNCNILEIC